MSIYVSKGFLILNLSTSQLLDLDIDKLLSYYWTWGPSAHTCIELMQGHQTVAQLEQSMMVFPLSCIGNTTGVLYS